MKLWMTGVVAFACIVAYGAVVAPNAAELDAAREEARAILADDFKALNAGRRTLVDVADHVAELAAASNSAAMVRVLQEGAFNLYRTADALGRAAERHVPFWINLGTDAEFEFRACPAGSFMMGCDDDRRSPRFRHKVNLPRPFWIAKYQTTKRLFNTFRSVTPMTEEEELYGGMDVPHGGLSRKEMLGFCIFLTRCNKDRLPKGYVFRLPTDAEWEYALNANCDDPADPYVRFRNGDESAAKEVAVSWSWVNEFRAERGYKPVNNGQGTVFAVGTRRPNAWGIHDMLGNGKEYVLDTVPLGLVPKAHGEGRIEDCAYDFGYADEETEPLRYFDGPAGDVITRGTKIRSRFDINWYDRTVVEPGSHYNGNFVFRIALAPDILAERRKEPAK